MKTYTKWATDQQRKKIMQALTPKREDRAAQVLAVLIFVVPSIAFLFRIAW